MGDLNSISNERISALMDGVLQADECALVLGGLLTDKQSIETWHVYQVVGDVLRSPELAPTRGDRAFWERLELRLSQEPEKPSSETGPDLSAMVDGGRAGVVDTSKPVANAPLFRWKLLAGVACSALVVVMGTGLWNQTKLHGGGEMAAVNPTSSAAPVVVATETSAGPMLRDPHLDELMAAHRQLGGHSALQLPTGFLRNATYEGASR
jgi:sigma-E factor negative regulatory protein RseA